MGVGGLRVGDERRVVHFIHIVRLSYSPRHNLLLRVLAYYSKQGPPFSPPS